MANVTNAIAGAIGGATAFTIVYPLQTITSRLQVQSSSSGVDSYKGTLHAFKKILEDEGTKGLYGGLGIGLSGVTVSQFVYFYCYSFLRRQLGVDTTDTTILESIIMPAGAGTLNVLITSPLWMINTRQKITLKKKDISSSTWAVAKEIYHEGGILRFWEGLTASLILVSNPIIVYSIFTQMRNFVLAFQKKKLLGRIEIAGLSAIAKLSAMAVTFPYILAKSRLQMQHKNKDNQFESDTLIKPYTGVLNCLIRVFKEEGFKGLYKGFRSKIMSSIIQIIFLFLVKNEILRMVTWLAQTQRTIRKLS